MARINYQDVQAPNIDAGRLIGSGGNLLVNSIGALGSTFKDNRLATQEAEALALKQQQDEADAYVMRNIAAQSDRAGMDTAFKGFLNDEMAKQARSSAFINAENLRSGRANQEQTYSNVRVNDANVGLIGAQARGVDARTAGTLLANRISQYNQGRIEQEHSYLDERARQLYSNDENPVAGYQDLQARTTLQNQAGDVRAAQHHYGTVGFAQELEALAHIQDEDKRALAMQDLLAGTDAETLNRAVGAGLIGEDVLGNMGKYTSAQAASIVSANTTQTNRNSEQANPEITSLFGASQAVAQGNLTPVTEAPISPVPQGYSEVPATVTPTTVTPTVEAPTNTKNPIINEMSSLYNKGQTETLSNEERNRMSKLVRETTPEERKAHGLPEDIASNMAGRNTGTSSIANMASGLTFSNKQALGKMGISSSEIDKAISAGLVPKDSQWSLETAKQLVDAIIKQQGGGEKAKNLLGNNIVKAAYKNHPELRNTYSDENHADFVNKVGETLYQAIKGNQQAPTTEGSKSPQGVPQKGILATAADNASTTANPASEVQQREQQVEALGNHAQKIGQGLSLVQNSADLNAILPYIEQANTPIIRDIQFYDEMLKADAKSRNLPVSSDNVTANAIIRGITDENKNIFKGKDEEDTQKTINRGITIMQSSKYNIPQEYYQYILENSINDDGSFNPEMVKERSESFNDVYVRSKGAIEDLNLQRQQIASIKEGIQTSYNTMKTLSKNASSSKGRLGQMSFEQSFDRVREEYAEWMIKGLNIYGARQVF